MLWHATWPFATGLCCWLAQLLLCEVEAMLNSSPQFNCTCVYEYCDSRSNGVCLRSGHAKQSATLTAVGHASAVLAVQYQVDVVFVDL